MSNLETGLNLRRTSEPSALVCTCTRMYCSGKAHAVRCYAPCGTETVSGWYVVGGPQLESRSRG
jgi:hypothetical protein